VIRGLGLPAEALETICRENLERIAGSEARPLDRRLAAAECRRIAAEIDSLGDETESAVAARAAAALES
jgi:hypothetical protein